MARRVKVLRHRAFSMVLAGEGISMVGDAAFTIGLAWAVVQATGSIAALAGVLLFQAIPRGVLLLLGGAIVDRFAPRTVMLGCHVARAVLLTAGAILASGGMPAIWQLSALALCMGVADAFFVPASESIIPDLLPDEELDKGIAVQGFFEQSAFIIGPMLGGLLISVAGVWLVFAVNAVTFAIAAVTVAFAPRRKPATREESASPRAIVRQIHEGLKHARQSAEVRMVLLVISAATLSYSGVFAVGLPALALSFGKEAAVGGATGLALMVAGWGAGQLVGTLGAVVTGLPRRWGLLIVAMTLVEAVAFICLGLAPHAWVVAAILFVVGIGVAYSSDVALPTYIQTHTPRHLLGRISALMSLPRVVFEPVSIALIGLALAWSTTWGFALAALPVLVAGFVLLLDPRTRSLSATTSRHQPDPVDVVQGVDVEGPLGWHG